jgi:hypothetical protein
MKTLLAWNAPNGQAQLTCRGMALLIGVPELRAVVQPDNALQVWLYEGDDVEPLRD